MKWTMGLMVGLAALAGAAGAAMADDYDGFPLDRHDHAFKRSCLTRRAVVIPPYRHVFPVRIYHVPPQQPYYNVPPYPVITPY